MHLSFISHNVASKRAQFVIGIYFCVHTYCSFCGSSLPLLFSMNLLEIHVYPFLPSRPKDFVHCPSVGFLSPACALWGEDQVRWIDVPYSGVCKWLLLQGRTFGISESQCLSTSEKQCPLKGTGTWGVPRIAFVCGSSVYEFKLCTFSCFPREAKCIHFCRWVSYAKFWYFDTQILLQSMCVIDL